MKFLRRFPATLLLVCILPMALFSQPIVTLEVEVEGTAYVADSTDFTKIARNREMTPIDGPGPVPPNFFNYVLIYDVVRVNGKPARGAHTASGIQIRTNPNPVPGTAIADTTRSTLAIGEIEIQDEDGRDVGMLSVQGYFGGAGPLGAPTGLGSNFAVVGGTGAFFGARGQVSQIAPAPGARIPGSMREDPSMRRAFGNQPRFKYTIQLIPSSVPQVENIYHSDFSRVTSASPAQPGETLIVQAKSLVPIVGTALGAIAPEKPGEVAVPVEVALNAQPAPIMNKVAWPGTSDKYRVDFQVPAGVTGEADLTLSVAWIPGAVVKIPIR